MTVVIKRLRQYISSIVPTFVITVLIGTESEIRVFTYSSDEYADITDGASSHSNGRYTLHCGLTSSVSANISISVIESDIDSGF